MGFSSSFEMGCLPRTKTRSTGSFLWPYLSVGAVDFPPGFCAACALALAVSLKDNGAVEKIATHREVEVFSAVGFEA